MQKISISVLVLALMIFSRPLWPCSAGGHIFVALASIEKLKQKDAPEAQRLASILEKYKWVVCWGAEGPDTAQHVRGYQFSHYLPLFKISYEHPERFDVKSAMPYFVALLKHAYEVHYGISERDIAKHGLELWQQPNAEWGEVSLAFAAGYISHLLSDYFCHYPAKVWWDERPEIQDACEKVTKRSYGQLQIVFADMLWERYKRNYGLDADVMEKFAADIEDYHYDNGVLPYCALACSVEFYRDWPRDVQQILAPDKYDACAAPFALGSGDLSQVLEQDHQRSVAILKAAGLELDEAIQISDELTSWKDVYGQVIAMIVETWAMAAPELGIKEVNKMNLLATRNEEQKSLPALIKIPQRIGTHANLVLHSREVLKTWHSRDGKVGRFVHWSEDPRARFDFGTATVGDERKLAILTHPPYWGCSGWTIGTYLLELPDTNAPIRFSAFTTLFANTQGSDGVVMKVIVVDEDGRRHGLLRRDVKTHKWTPCEIDLSPFRAQQIRLELITDAGTNDNTIRDNAAWGQPIISVGE